MFTSTPQIATVSNTPMELWDKQIHRAQRPRAWWHIKRSWLMNGRELNLYVWGKWNAFYNICLLNHDYKRIFFKVFIKNYFLRFFKNYETYNVYCLLIIQSRKTIETTIRLIYWFYGCNRALLFLLRHK